MAKRGYQKQLSLPFNRTRVAQVFDSFQPEVIKCHQLQDAAGSTSGNDFYWWQSRFGEWLQSLRPSWGFDRYYETGKLFPSFWERYEQSLTRRMPAGIPRAALEDQEIL